MLLFLSILFFLTTCFLLFLLYKSVKTIFTIEDNVKLSLDNLQYSRTKIEKILNTPLYSDSLEIREIYKELKEVENIVIGIIENTEIIK